MIGVLAAAAFLSKKAPEGPAALPLDKSWLLALGAAFIYVFYAYGGYQNTINFGADVHNARRNVPRAIFFGILIVLACYLTINAAYVKVLGVPGIAGAKLVAAETARVTLGEAGKLVVSLAIFLSAMGFLNVTLMQIPRVYYSMAEDRTLPAVFQKVNPKTQTQEFGLLFLGAIILVSIFLLKSSRTSSTTSCSSTRSPWPSSSSSTSSSCGGRPAVPARSTTATACPSTPSCRSSSSLSSWASRRTSS